MKLPEFHFQSLESLISCKSASHFQIIYHLTGYIPAQYIYILFTVVSVRRNLMFLIFRPTAYTSPTITHLSRIKTVAEEEN